MGLSGTCFVCSTKVKVLQIRPRTSPSAADAAACTGRGAAEGALPPLACLMLARTRGARGLPDGADATDCKTKITGTAQILEIFKVSGAGKVAGSKVTEGEINSASDVRIIRDGAIIYTGKVSTIFREKNQVKQVSDGQECGITVKDYMDFQKNDTIEAFSVTSTERSI